MTEYRTVLERAGSNAPSPDLPLERILRRRDRKRRNQRITAGVVGIAVFVAAVWIVTNEGWFDRTETPAVPGPAETGPTGSPDAGWEGFDLPPEGAVPSSPETGKVIARFTGQLFGSIVYADGRVIFTSRAGQWVEQRLTPEGVDLFRSGAVEPRRLVRPGGPSLPAGAWAEPDVRPYVASRYAVCYAKLRALGPGAVGATEAAPPGPGELVGSVDPSRVVSLLPAKAQDLLRGKERDLGNHRCSELTTAEARNLEQILLDAGFEGFLTPEGAFAFEDKVGNEVWFVISCDPLFPHQLSG